MNDDEPMATWYLAVSVRVSTPRITIKPRPRGFNADIRHPTPDTRHPTPDWTRFA